MFGKKEVEEESKPVDYLSKLFIEGRISEEEYKKKKLDSLGAYNLAAENKPSREQVSAARYKGYCKKLLDLLKAL